MTRRSSMARDCASKLKVLAEPTRLAVMETLMDGPKYVGQINGELEIDQSLLSHHLKVLRDAGLVETLRDGKSVLYGLAADVRRRRADRMLDLGCCKLAFD